MKQNYVTLNDGNKIPQFGLGVYMVRGDEPTREACLAALQMGYRHIDTAHAYQNERGVGAAVRESGIPREEIWITSKLWPIEYGEGKTMEGIDKMLGRLGTDLSTCFCCISSLAIISVHGAIWKKLWHRVKSAPLAFPTLNRNDWKKC